MIKTNSEKGTAVALGNFDGLHIGHMAVINNIADTPYDAAALIVNSSFSLMTCQDVVSTLAEKGIKAIFADFDEIRNMDCEAFVREILVEKLNARVVSCGYNFHFGAGASGNVDDLKRLCDKYGISLALTPEVKCGENSVSSTVIRKMLADGDCKTASKLLGRPFSFSSPVIHGDSRGRTIGFPTANQYPPEKLIELKHGVYKTRVTIDGGQYNAITNYGIRPTYQVKNILSETHIINFDGDIYSKNIRVSFLDFIREERRFDSINELKKQMEKDLASVK